ncbi:DNA/RNA non-specific endonuclease [Lignipirellula cremea]|uniref:Type VII secretion system protein EssD-like domain-containing protein n=1 Tax=Lignipirellula cremea TaxID=2528010 RepID=A0A518DN49_9BACT|nr:DNA/RNA non-specific endonuclease [Lignipirellula cremea]QDU93267.1 hypothetical protein Pla8534_10460 [Lignipirellula cremea]
MYDENPGLRRRPEHLLRSPDWIEDYGAHVGGYVYLDMPEMGAEGLAEVLAIEPAPEIEPLPAGCDPSEYRLVTGTFKHTSGEVYDLKLASESKPIGVTGSHPFWSVDREAWVSVLDLEIGETLKTLDGTTVVESLVRRPGSEPVYNIEVEGDHVYRVGESGVLVHNASAPSGPLDDCQCEEVGTSLKVSQIVVGGRTYSFKWDECRTTEAMGPIIAVDGDGDRNENEQKKMLNVFFGKNPNSHPLRNSYDAGHLIANDLGGPGGFTNLVPQVKVFNQNRAWKKMEEWVHGCIANNTRIASGEMKVEVTYDTSQQAPQRDIPTKFKVTVYMLTPNGGQFGVETLNFDNSDVAIQKRPGDTCPGALF